MQRVKNIANKAWQIIVGAPLGWSAEGNEQWYYFLALVINIMLTWWLKPELGILFTVVSVLHFVVVCLYGGLMLLDYESKAFTYAVLFFAFSFVIFEICLIVNWWWTLITSAIVIIAYLSAPDCCGYNIFMPFKKLGPHEVDVGNTKVTKIMLCHTILFAVFVIVTFLLPLALHMKIIILCMALIIHPFIDACEGECIIISDVVQDSLSEIIKKIKSEN